MTRTFRRDHWADRNTRQSDHLEALIRRAVAVADQPFLKRVVSEGRAHTASRGGLSGKRIRKAVQNALGEFIGESLTVRQDLLKKVGIR